MLSATLSLVLAGLGMGAVGLFMSFSPTLYAVVIHALNTSPAPRTVLRALALGLGAGVAVLLAVFRVLDPSTLTEYVLTGVRSVLVHRTVDVVAGGLLLGLAARTALRPRHQGGGRNRGRASAEEELAQALPEEGGTASGSVGRNGHPWGMFWFGAASAGLSSNRLVIVYTTSRAAVEITPRFPLELALYAVFLAGLMVPYLLAHAAWHRFPRAAQRFHGWYQRLGSLNLRPLEVALLALVGLAFLALGVLGRGLVL